MGLFRWMLQLALYGVWAYWLLCCAFPLWRGGWMRRYRLLFYAGTLGLWALWFVWAVRTVGRGVGPMLGLACLQVVSARATLWVAYTCYTHFIAPPARGEEGARGSVRVRRVVYLLICALCAAFVLPEWTQTAGYSILSLFA